MLELWINKQPNNILYYLIISYDEIFKQKLILFFYYHLKRFYKKAAAFVLRAVAKHSPQLAQSVVDCGALDSLVICLEEFDPTVKEAAAWALGYIARHNGGLLQIFQLLIFTVLVNINDMIRESIIF